MDKKYYSIKESAELTGYSYGHILKYFIKTGQWDAHQVKNKRGSNPGDRGSQWFIEATSIPTFLRQVPKKSVTKLKIIK